MQQSSATPSLKLWFWGVAEDCCMLSILLAVPSCIYSFWHVVIPTSYFIFIYSTGVGIQAPMRQCANCGSHVQICGASTSRPTHLVDVFEASAVPSSAPYVQLERKRARDPFIFAESGSMIKDVTEMFSNFSCPYWRR